MSVILICSEEVAFALVPLALVARLPLAINLNTSLACDCDTSKNNATFHFARALRYTRVSILIDILNCSVPFTKLCPYHLLNRRIPFTKSQNPIY